MATKDPQTPTRRRSTPAQKADKTVRSRKVATPAKQQPADPLALFAEIDGILAESRAPEALKRGLQAVEKACRPRSTWAVVHDAAFDRLNVAQARGRADARVAAASPGEGPVGIAFSDSRPVVDAGVVALPMLAFGKTVGVLAILNGNFQGDGGPDEEELVRLQAVANACGAATENAQTRNEGEKRARELQAAAERLREGDRTRDALLSHLSHELRTPLTTLKGYLSMALKGRLGELNERQMRAMSVCDQNTNRLLRLINDLLLTARLQAGKMTLDPKPLGLRTVLTEATEYLQADAEVSGVAMDLSAPSGQVFIRGNKDRLVEGFMHLLERGLRGKRPGERIQIEVAPRGRVGAVEILLEGVFVAESEVEHLFEPFRAEGGSPNIGLSIARQVFDLHGGHISAEQGEKGLIFHVALPLFAGVVTAAVDRPEPRQGEILIVEDDDDCRNGLIEYLEAEQYKVRAYADGREALQRIQEHPPALVLLDLRIPGVDGAALVKTLRESEKGQHTPIYVISGAIDAGAGTEEAWGERVDGVFEKPINFPYLLERVREYVAPESEAS